jgi:uncharacterized membrane protein YkvA (DUF1232 family)
MDLTTHVTLPDVEAGIAGVRPDDVSAVREGIPEKLAALRPLLRLGTFGGIRELVFNIRSLFQLVADPEYPVPWRTTAAAVFALGYFLLSIDAIPDVVPVLGFVDDALVVAEIALLLSTDLRRYREFRARRAAARRAAPPPAARAASPDCADLAA